jgi:hypothetical protein
VISEGSTVTVVDSVTKATADISASNASSAAPFTTKIVHKTSRASAHAPVIFKSADSSAVLTFLNATTVVGVVLDHTHNRTLSVASERHGRALGAALALLPSNGSPGVGASRDRATRGSDRGDGQPHEIVGESIASRHARAVAKWDNCYPGDDVKHSVAIGVAVDSRLFSNRFGSDEGETTAWLASIFASANAVYETQLNIVLRIGDIFIQNTDSAAPSWNNPNCALDLDASKPLASKTLNAFKAWAKPKPQGT